MDAMTAQNGPTLSFEELVQQLMSPENANRTRAEELFNQAKQQPDLLVSQLMAVLRQSHASESRGLSAILLRKVRFWNPGLVCPARQLQGIALLPIAPCIRKLRSLGLANFNRSVGSRNLYQSREQLCQQLKHVRSYRC